MKSGKLLGSLLAILVLAVSLIGCSKPPEAEKEAAKAAMDAAISAGADKYAAADLEDAKKRWEAAESQMREKKYSEAKQSYIDAKAAFEKAAQAVETGRKAFTDQAEAALTGIEESWRNVEGMAKKAGKRLKEREVWTADARAVNEGLEKVKEMIATDPYEAKAKLDDLKAIVDKWENRLKEMGTRPAASGKVKTKQESSSKGIKEFSIARIAVGTGVENSEPVEVSETFPAATEKIYCFLEASDIAADTEVTFVWFHGEKETTKLSLPIKAGARWRTWVSKNLRGVKGDWRVEIRDPNGTPIKDIRFRVE